MYNLMAAEFLVYLTFLDLSFSVVQGGDLLKYIASIVPILSYKLLNNVINLEVLQVNHGEGEMTSVARRREQDDSGEYSDASQDIEQNNSGIDGAPHESDYDSQGSDSEHSDGDPEQQEAERRVDDDEDRSNPQYIPKRGTFYEHDDRTAASGEETTNTTSETVSEKKEGTEAPAERRRPPRKSETSNKWSHDKYNENEQVPKSRDELVAIYGYDIRNEDAPPHARRNRRYGRGPNKYTRTWEDEEAYRRQLAHKKPPSPGDFPELTAVNKPGRKPRARPRSKSQPASNESSENGSQLRRNASIKTPKQKPVKQNTPKPNVKQAVKENVVKMENLTISAPVNNSTQRRVSAQQRPVPSDTRHSQPPMQNNSPKPQAQQKPQQTQPTPGSEPLIKRYSSLRQRPLAEPYSPQQAQQPQQQQQPHQQQQPQQPQQRYHGEFVSGQQTQHQGSLGPQMHSQQIIHSQQVHRNAPNQPQHGPSPPHQPPQHPPGQHPPGPHPPAQLPPGQHPPGQHPPGQHPPGQLPPGQLPPGQLPPGQLPPGQHPPQHPPAQLPPGQQHTQQRRGLHEHHALHSMPQPHAIGQLQPAQGYAPPAMMPAQYMQGGSSGGVYPALYPPAAYPQLYQHHNFTSGVTYYSCAEQEQAPRALRRPTAAIPIVRPDRPPPADRPANSTEKDNIDRIVENMFVRKPWPAHGADGKEKQDRNSQEPQSKETSQPNSLTSSSISTDSKTEKNEEKTDKTETQEIVERTESENPEGVEA